MVYNIASLQSSTDYVNLKLAFEKAKIRHIQLNPSEEFERKIVFDVQPFTADPLLCVVDYLCWAVQRKFETGEDRFMNYMNDKIKRVLEL